MIKTYRQLAVYQRLFEEKVHWQMEQFLKPHKK